MHPPTVIMGLGDWSKPLLFVLSFSFSFRQDVKSVHPVFGVRLCVIE